MAKALNVSLAVTADTSQAKAQLQQLQTTLQQLTTNSANLQIGLDPKKIQEAAKYALDLSAHLKTATDSTTGMLNFSKFESQIKRSGMSIEKYGQQLINLGPQGRQAFMQMTEAIAKSEIPMKRMSGVLGQFGTVIANTIRWQASSSLIHGFMGSIQQAYRYAQDLNQSLNNIQIVTQMSDTQMGKFAESANKAAKSLSTTTTSYTDAALIYYQQGIRDQNEINKRTDATIKMANVTGQSAQQVSNQMTAIWNNFAKGGDNLEYYADVITALGAATASSSEEISRGLEKFAATADTVGLSYENATAALATITATTRQSADSVGTGLRTLFARLDSLKLGETLEDGVDLTKYTKALQSVGVQVLDTNGNLKRMDDILDELGERWGDISDTQKVALAQTVGGVRQYTTLMALMNNFDFYKENVDIAKNSQGTLQQQQEIYEKSWAASAKRVRASLETIYSTLIDDKFFIDFNDGFAKVLNTINNIIIGLGGMKGILGTLSGAFIQTFTPQITQSLYKFGAGVADLITVGGSAANRRTATVNNLAAMYMGMEPTDQPLDVSTLNQSQQFQYNAFRNKMEMQQSYMANAAYMVPWQQQAAQMAMDQYNSTVQQIINQQNQLAMSKSRFNEDIGTAQIYLRQAIKNQGYTNPYEIENRTTGWLSQDTGEMALWARNIKMLEMGKNGTYTLPSEMTRDDLIATFGAENSDIVDELIEGQKANGEYIFDYSKALKLAQTRYGERKELLTQNLVENGNLSKGLAAKILEGAYNNEKGELDLGLMSKEEKEEYERAKRAAEAKSTGMKIASGITNFAGGAVSALTAAKQFDTLAESIKKVHDGSLDMGEGITQALTAGSMGLMNFGRSMSQFTMMFGGNALAGGAFAIIMTALPALIKTFDNMSTTAEERLNLINSTAEDSATIAENAKTAYDQLLNDFSGHSSLLSSLEELTQGTLEFEAALLKANSAAYDLINNYGLTADEWSINDQGAVVISEEGKQRVQAKQLAESQRTQNVALAYSAYQAMQQSGANVADMEKVYQEQSAKIRNKLSSTGGYDFSNYLELAGKARNATEEAALQEALNNSTYGKQLSQLIETYQKELSSNKAIQDIASKYGMSSNMMIQSIQNGSLNQDYNTSSGTTSKYLTSVTGSLQTMRQQDNATFTQIDKYLAEAIAQSEGYENALKSDTITTNYSDDYINQLRNSQKGSALTYMSNDEVREYLGNIDVLNDQFLSQVDNGAIDVEQFYIEQMQKIYDWSANEAKDNFDNLKNQQNLTDRQIAQQVQSAWVEKQSSDYISQTDKEIQDIFSKNPKLQQGLENFSQLTFSELSSLMVNNLGKSDTLDKVLGRYYSDWYKAANDFEKEAFEGTSDKTDGAALLTSVNNLAQTLNPQGFKELLDLKSNLVSIMGDAGNDEFAKVVTKFGQGNATLKNFYESLDFSKGANNILKQIKNTKNFKNDTIAQTAYDTIYQAMGGDTGVFQNLYNDVFTDDKMMKKFSDTFKKTGKISAESIYELVDESEAVADALEVGTFNAEGLASALEAINNEELNINADSISNTFLKAMSTAGAVKNQLAYVFQYIDDYQKERSAGDIGEFYQGLVKDVNTSISKGLFGDNLFKQSFKEMFGESGMKDLTKFLEKTAGMTDKEKQEAWKNDKDMSRYRSAMKEVESTGHMGGMYDYYLNNPSGNKDYIAKDENGNSISGATISKNKKGTYDIGKNKGVFGYTKKGGFHISNVDAFFNEFQTQEDFTKFLQSQGASEEMARSMASDISSRNNVIDTKWTQGSIAEALKEFQAGIDKGEYLSGDELTAFENKYADYLKDGQFTKQIEALRAQTIGLGKDFDYNTSSFDNFSKQFQKNSGKNIKDAEAFLTAQEAGLQPVTEIIEKYNDGINAESGTHKEFATFNARDLENTAKAFEKLGYSSTQANAQIDRAFANERDTFGELSFNIREADGSLRKMTTKSGSDFDTWLNDTQGGLDAFGGSITKAIEQYQQAMEQDFQNKSLAESLSQALGDVKITLTGGEEGATEAVTTINDILKGVNPVDINGNDLATGVAKKAVNAINKMAPIIKITGQYTPPNNLPSDSSGGGGGGHAAGINKAKGFAGGRHSNNDFQGIAETGELGPELWVHDGQPALTGIHGRNKIFVSKGDQIFTASQTREILRNNPSLQDIPGFDDGKPGDSSGITVYGTDGGKKKGGSGDSKDDKGKDYKPERYHVISRQLTVLEKQYERLEKAKENAYGTNILDAIEDEIAAQDQIIAKQRELIQEVEKWKAEDLKKLKELGVKYTLDANGEIANWDALQKKYEKAAQTSDDENAKKIWEAIQQYEETVDKLRDETDKLQEEIYKQMQLRLEKITLQAELKIKFDDKQIKLLEHQLSHLEDNIYATGEALALMGDQMERIHDQMNSTQQAINGIFSEMTDSKGNKIDLTLDQFLALSAAEKDALGINGAFGEALEEQIDNLLEYVEALEEYKTNGVDRLAKAFDELSDNVDNAMSKFGYFTGILTTLRDIVDLQNIKFPKSLRDSVKQVQSALMNTSTNNIKAYQDYYRSLEQEANAVRQHLAETTDTDLAKKYQEQLDELEDKMRDCMSEITDLWQATLAQAKEDFEQQLDWLVEDYEETLSGIYGTLDMYGDAFDRERKVRERYVEDYEKYYQLSKLQRSINKDLDKSAQAGYKGNKQLRDLLKEIQDLQASGKDISAYELEVLEKRYEYFKALADLEEARDAKHTVRLQRDRNGNWGYVYTANEDELEDLQQKADDKLHELQEFIRSSQDDLEDQIQELYSSYTTQRVDMIKNGASAEALAKFDEYFMGQLNYLQGQWQESLDDAGSTVDTAKDRYKQDSFDIIDLFGETATAALQSTDSMAELFNIINETMADAANDMTLIVNDYSAVVERLNSLIGGEAPFAENLSSFVESINTASDNYLDVTKNAVKEFKDSYDEILKAAETFESKYTAIYEEIIKKNMALIDKMQKALDDLNRYQNTKTGSGNNNNNKPSTPSSGSNGSGGGGKSGGGSGDKTPTSGAPLKEIKLTYGNWGDWISDGTAGHHRERPELANGKPTGKIDKSKIVAHSWGSEYPSGSNNINLRKCKVCGFIGEVKKTNNKINNSIKKAEAKDATKPKPKTIATLKNISSKITSIAKLDSGGYTGDWGSGEGRWAILHEKEQVFNKEDTARLLLASKILQTIDIQARYASGAFGNVSSPMVGSNAQVVQQNVQITASFPNAVNHAEIEEAFNNLSNKAVQYANRKNK